MLETIGFILLTLWFAASIVTFLYSSIFASSFYKTTLPETHEEILADVFGQFDAPPTPRKSIESESKLVFYSAGSFLSLLLTVWIMSALSDNSEGLTTVSVIFDSTLWVGGVVALLVLVRATVSLSKYLKRTNQMDRLGTMIFRYSTFACLMAVIIFVAHSEIRENVHVTNVASNTTQTVNIEQMATAGGNTPTFVTQEMATSTNVSSGSKALIPMLSYQYQDGNGVGRITSVMRNNSSIIYTNDGPARVVITKEKVESYVDGKVEQTTLRDLSWTFYVPSDTLSE